MTKIRAEHNHPAPDGGRRPVRILGALVAILAVSLIAVAYTVTEALDRSRAHRLEAAHRARLTPAPMLRAVPADRPGYAHLTRHERDRMSA